MTPQKIYYTVIILISVVSILLSPFMYIQTTRKRKKTRPEIKNDWKIVALSSLIMAAVLLLLWLVWLR